MKKWLSLSLILATALVGCSSNNEVKKDNSNQEGITLTVVTDRTDAEALYSKMEADFIALHPEVTDIIWESSSDYDNYITTRMNTKDYGDVLMIPFSMSGTPSDYETFFEPLGTVEELEKRYLDVTEADYNDMVYGLPTALNSLGIIYNAEVFQKAGVTEIPTSTEEFLEVCEKIQSQTDAIPFYTNYSGVAIWVGALSSYGGEDFKENTLEAGTAFQEGQPIREVMDLLYQLASNGYIEQDPITADAAKAKQMLANGEIAMMMRGSQDAAEIQEIAGEKSTIKISPLPVIYEGKTSLALGAPSVMGINKNSSNKEMAKVFLEYFVSAASGYADDLGGMSPNKADLTEEQKAMLEESRVVLTAPPTAPEIDTIYSAIANEVGIARLTDVLQKTINIALYPEQNESYEVYVADLESSWKKAFNNHVQ